ncbi:MAG: SDR family oxidoreductase [Tetrasphaera sp.]
MTLIDDMTELAAIDLTGQRILVVGGYGGIGGAVAQLLSSAGAAVAIAGRDPHRAQHAAGYLPRAVGVLCDVTDPDSCAAAIADTVTALGGIDILINCAGSLSVAPSLIVDKESLQATVDSNLVGAFTIAQAAGRAMKAAGGGRIIQVSSVRAYAGTKTGFAAYGAAKAGVNQLVRQLATEWAEHNILVNGIAPGFVETPFVDAPTHNKEFVERVRRRIPMGRLGKPEEIAGAVLFLCSPLSTFVTGQIIVIDGGVTASQ